jgi:hypothetical protein
MNAVRIVAWVLVLAAGLACAAAPAQSPAPVQAQPAPAVATPQPPNFQMLNRPDYGVMLWDGRSSAHQSESAQLAQQYVKATKEEEKREIRKKLADVLGQQFDAHIQQQQKELEDLEKQLASLRAIVKKRLDAKTPIVDRRIDQLVQEAEGLGWNAPATPHPVWGAGGSSYRPPTTAPGPGQPAKAPEPAKH